MKVVKQISTGIIVYNQDPDFETGQGLTLANGLTQIDIEDLQEVEITLAEFLCSPKYIPDPIGVEIQQVSIHEAPSYATDIEESYFKQMFTKDIDNTEGPHIIEISFPYAVAVLGGSLNVRTVDIGDECKVEIAPLTVAGQLTSTSSVNDTHIHVNADCTEYYVWKSDKITLTDGVNTQDVGRVISKADTTVNIETPLTYEFATGTVVKVTTEIVPQFKFLSTGEVVIGRKTNRGMYMPANYPLVFTYTNKSLTAKTIGFDLEWYA